MTAQYFAEFSWAPAGPLPSSVFRRTTAADGLPEDSYVGRDGTWHRDANHTLGLWMQHRTDHEFEPITEADAEEFIDMVSTGRQRPFSSSHD